MVKHSCRVPPFPSCHLSQHRVLSRLKLNVFKCAHGAETVIQKQCSQEILYGRDLDVQPREEDFRSLRACAITPYDRGLICASLQASAVAMRCIAAGLQFAETVLDRRAKRRQDAHQRKPQPKKGHKKKASAKLSSGPA